MNPDIKYEIVMVITMTACFVSGFLFASWNDIFLCLTGYAQLYGKYNTSAYDKLRLDLIYIENRSLLLGMKLIMLTLKILFIPESTEGFSDEAVQLMRVEMGDRNLMV